MTAMCAAYFGMCAALFSVFTAPGVREAVGAGVAMVAGTVLDFLEGVLTVLVVVVFVGVIALIAVDDGNSSAPRRPKGMPRGEWNRHQRMLRRRRRR